VCRSGPRLSGLRLLRGGAPLVTDLASVSIERTGDIVVAAVSGEIDFSVADDVGRQILESSE
jgi:hypothetical protein